MRADEGFASPDVAAGRPTRSLRLSFGIGAFWLFGSAIVAVAQPSADRGIAAVGTAVAGIVTILAVGRLTPDRDRRYFRSVLGAMVVVSVVGDLLVQHLVSGANGFVAYGMDTRIALPLIVVLLAPLVFQALPVQLRSRALWRERSRIMREARPLDWLATAYALLIVPDLLLGVLHHAPKTYIAQDLGLIVFFVFAYVVGRTIDPDTARSMAAELVTVLVLLAAVQALVAFNTTPIFTYAEAASAAAVGFAVLRPTKTRVVLLCVAVAVLANDALEVKRGTGSTTAVELAAALGIIAYLLVRARGLVPQWLAVGLAAVALVGFLGFTADGLGVLGRYYGTDPSKAGRTFEANQVRRAIHSSPVSFVFGRGLGGSIDETHAPKVFAESLAFGGRDLAQVQAVHLLPYEFLLKYGLLGFAWLAAFVTAVVILGVSTLEKAARRRDPSLVIYAAIPLLGVAAALAASTHLQDNPLNALAVGVLATRTDLVPRLAGKASRPLRLGLALPAAALICAVAGAIAFRGNVPAFGSPAYVSPLVPQWKTKAIVGGAQLNYPPQYHRQYFATSSHAVTGVSGAQVHGVVVASYPLKRHPELRGSGQVLRPDGVFFELYRVPHRGYHLGATKTLPLILFDFPQIRAFRNTPGVEQGGAHFRVDGHDYQALMWVGKDAPKSAFLTVDGIIDSIAAKSP